MTAILFARELGIWAAVVCIVIAVHLQFARRYDIPWGYPAMFYVAGVVLLALSSTAIVGANASRYVAFGAFLAAIAATAAWAWLAHHPDSPTRPT